ncbi:ethanolamine ammonia-lyase subunit EutC [Spirosoma harenae]
MNELKKSNPEVDEWASLKAYTTARIALGRTGVSIPFRESLRFKLAHAHAKDAVYSQLDIAELKTSLTPTGLPIHTVLSRAENRDIYLQRPDFGRLLHDSSIEKLQQLAHSPSDIGIIIADGLSATAVMKNAALLINPFVEKIRKSGYSLAPIILVEQGRVAVMDVIGELLQTQLAIILIGERPGLSSFDSMGAYITYGPKSGLTDERRNCISNIREQGLAPTYAADKLLHLIQNAFRLQVTGVALKDIDGLLE